MLYDLGWYHSAFFVEKKSKNTGQPVIETGLGGLNTAYMLSTLDLGSRASCRTSIEVGK